MESLLDGLILTEDKVTLVEARDSLNLDVGEQLLIVVQGKSCSERLQ